MRSFRFVLPAIAVSLLSGALAAQLRQIAMVDLPGRPGFDSMAFAKGYLVIAHRGANAVDIFDPRLRRLKTQITGMSDPRGIAVDEANGRVYIANAGNSTLAVLNANDWSVADNIPLKHSPDSLLFSEGKLYVGDWLEDSVTIMDLERRTELSTVNIGSRPQQMLWDPVTKYLFVSAEQAGEVVAIGGGDHIAKRYPLAASLPTGLALDAKGRRLFVAVRHAVLALDADTGTEIARVQAAGGIDALWFDDSQPALFAAAGDGSVTVMATSGDRLAGQRELRTQVRGHSFAYDPAKKMVYLTGGREGRSKVVILKRVETQLAGPASGVAPAKAEVTAEKR